MTGTQRGAPLRISLNSHLFSSAGVSDDLRHLILHISSAIKYISHAIKTSESGLSGGTNFSGEEQLKLDVLSNCIFEQHLRESNLVSCYSSEEEKELVELSDSAGFCVVFDPLDGSSLVDANFAIGSIAGIFNGNGIVGKKPNEQVCALYALYGPRTILVYSSGRGVHEFILNDVGEFILLSENLGVSDQAKNFSPGNLRAISDNNEYGAVLSDWLKRELTLRYSGCMAADIHHIISKGQGVFSNVGGGKYPGGKLRLVYECGPFAFLVENAGGKASDGKIPILEKEITDLHQRTPIIIGSKNEVENVCRALNG